MQYILTILFFLSISRPIFSQERVFLPSEVLDSTYGVEFYEKYNPLMGKDSIRKHEGYAVKGNITDKYANGKILHKGYYIDGQLKTYSNYYPSGKIERQFRPISDIDYKLIKYYENSIIKSEVIINRGNIILWRDFFENGNLELEEIYFEKDLTIKSKKTGYENGFMESELIITNKKKKLYWEKNFHPNGKIAHEGEKRYDEGALGYLKTGKWKLYNDAGTLIKEETYINDIKRESE
jgi:antitoxin component YwqK of YwqJK toxin-antitoxin module